MDEWNLGGVSSLENRMVSTSTMNPLVCDAVSDVQHEQTWNLQLPWAKDGADEILSITTERNACRPKQSAQTE